MNLDNTFHLPSLKTRLSESPVDKIIFAKEITNAAASADNSVLVPFKDDSYVYGILMHRFTVGETTTGTIEIADSDDMTAIGNNPALLFAIGVAHELK